MLIPMAIMSKGYNIRTWKMIPASLLLTVAGTTGTYIWYFIENYGIGRSFYGAVFMVPMFFPFIAMLLREKYLDLLDLCAPAVCVMLALMKVQCLIDGCCSGIVLLTTAEGVPVRFPSQMVELVNALLIFAALVYLATRKNNRGKIYPLYMLIYGTSRFALNYFRAGITPFMLGMSAGHFWSVCSILVGSAWLFAMSRMTAKKAVDLEKTT